MLEFAKEQQQNSQAIACLSSIEMRNRGGTCGVVHKGSDGNADMMAHVWIADGSGEAVLHASVSSLELGTLCVRKPWRQIADNEVTDPENAELTVPQPKACL